MAPKWQWYQISEHMWGILFRTDTTEWVQLPTDYYNPKEWRNA